MGDGETGAWWCVRWGFIASTIQCICQVRYGVAGVVVLLSGRL